MYLHGFMNMTSTHIHHGYTPESDIERESTCTFIRAVMSDPARTQVHPLHHSSEYTTADTQNSIVLRTARPKSDENTHQLPKQLTDWFASFSSFNRETLKAQKCSRISRTFHYIYTHAVDHTWTAWLSPQVDSTGHTVRISRGGKQGVARVARFSRGG